MTSLRNTIACFVLISLITLCIGGCNVFRPFAEVELPPLLSQDELIRPYDKLGRIQITREVYGIDYSLAPDIKEWGSNAVRLEAGKMGADAVTLFEVDGRSIAYSLFPSTEYRATGIAIKFK